MHWTIPTWGRFLFRNLFMETLIIWVKERYEWECLKGDRMGNKYWKPQKHMHEQSMSEKDYSDNVYWLTCMQLIVIHRSMYSKYCHELHLCCWAGYFGLAVASPYVGMARFQDGGPNQCISSDSKRFYKHQILILFQPSPDLSIICNSNGAWIMKIRSPQAELRHSAFVVLTIFLPTLFNRNYGILD